MPLDGAGLGFLPPSDTGLFPLWSRQGLRLWLRGSFNRQGGNELSPEILLPLCDRAAAAEEVLREAKELISDPRFWMRGTYWWFRGRRCAVGALRAAAKRIKDPVPAWLAHSLLIAVARARGFANAEAMNDRSSHSAVLHAFDEAIALARAALPFYAESEAA